MAQYGQRRRHKKKEVGNIDELDSWLDRVAHIEHGKPIPDDDWEDEEELRLHLPVAYMQRTWYAYHTKSLLPRAGGIDDQLEAWWDDIDAIYGRYNRFVEQMRDTPDSDPPPRSSSKSGGVDLLDMIRG